MSLAMSRLFAMTDPLISKRSVPAVVVIYSIALLPLLPLCWQNTTTTPQCQWVNQYSDDVAILGVLSSVGFEMLKLIPRLITEERVRSPWEKPFSEIDISVRWWHEWKVSEIGRVRPLGSMNELSKLHSNLCIRYVYVYIVYTLTYWSNDGSIEKRCGGHQNI